MSVKYRIIPIGGGGSPVPPTPPYDPDYFCITAETGNVTFSYTNICNLELSLDGINWIQTRDGGFNYSFPKIYLRGNNPDGLNSNTSSHFNISGTNVSLSGDINTLLSWTERIDVLPLSAFTGLFYNCGIYDASQLVLPATTLSNSCYTSMFQNCATLTAAPELPATTIAPYCYQYMFNGCTALTTAPELPATTLYIGCYKHMFYGCTALTAAPELPATTLANNCYNSMFSGCSSLTTAPALPATTLVANCYPYMFANCTSLTAAPELPAATLAQSCYNSMFYCCSSLNKIIVYATEWNTTNTSNWVSDVSSTGDFYNLGGATIQSGDNGIPTSWTVHTSL